MPFSHERYNDGVFVCRLDERINEADARQWAKFSKHYAYTEKYPIIALIDVRDASYVTANARQILSRAADKHFLHAVAVVAGDFIVEQNMRLVAMMSASKNIEVFNSLEDAQEYATNHAKLLQEIHGKVPDVF